MSGDKPDSAARPASDPPPAVGGGGAAAAGSAAPHELEPFDLERFFAKWEFTAEHLLCCSDSEPLMMSELLALADADARQRWEGLRLSYTQTQGLPALREAIAATHYTSLGPDQLVCAAPQELLYLCMRALLRPGDRVVCCFPGYQSLYSVARSMGCQVDPWCLSSAADGSLSFDMAHAERLITPATRLVVVNSPHNPSGAHFSQQEWRRLGELCQAAGAHLFSDEMYRTLELDPAERLPAAADLVQPGGISLCGMSKAAGMPGVRIGWLATHDAALIQRVLELKDFTTICSSAPSEVLALIGLRSYDTLLQRSLAVIRANLDTLDAFFARWRHVIAWRRPSAGTVAFPRLLTGEGVEAWCEAAVQQAGVLLMPASVYSDPPSTQAGHFRLGFGRRDLPRCLEHFEAFLTARYPPLPPPAKQQHAGPLPAPL